MVDKYSCVLCRRGAGFMQGLVFDRPVGPIINKALEKGLMLINAGTDIIRFVPPLIITKENIDDMITILDECIPFYQLAVHGYINYTGYPLNICGDDKQELLLSAEYGAGLQFTLMKESTFALQKTLFTEYYGSDYDAWRDRMVDIYTRYNAELGHTFNQEMTGHENLTDTLSCTTYADGTKVYVNYDYVDVTFEGKTIPARDYLVEK